MKGMRRRCGFGAAEAGSARRIPGILAAALLLLAAVAGPAAASDNTAAALEAAGWSESSPGWLTALPSRTVEIRDSGIGGEFVLAPRTAVVWERRWKSAPGPGTTLEIVMSSEAPNASSDDYREGRASFPVSVTAVFGRDSQSVPIKTRIGDFFAGFWRGFRPGGISLTYATGNVAPVGSMYRLSDEETVFILGGDEEKGKAITTRRNLAADFRAAYGRDPRGPVTRLRVQAGRPSGETGTIKAGIRLLFPGQ